jgi:hypothetical protein
MNRGGHLLAPLRAHQKHPPEGKIVQIGSRVWGRGLPGRPIRYVTVMIALSAEG